MACRHTPELVGFSPSRAKSFVLGTLRVFRIVAQEAPSFVELFQPKLHWVAFP